VTMSAGDIVPNRAESLNQKSPWLYGFWYPGLRSDRVRGRRLATAMLLGIPLVVGRKGSGQPFVLRDACPHRGMPLSFGNFDGELLQCSYHGWCFEAASGQCHVDVGFWGGVVPGNVPELKPMARAGVTGR